MTLSHSQLPESKYDFIANKKKKAAIFPFYSFTIWLGKWGIITEEFGYSEQLRFFNFILFHVTRMVPALIDGKGSIPACRTPRYGMSRASCKNNNPDDG